MEGMETAQGFYEIIKVPCNTNIFFTVMEDPGSYVPNHWHNAFEILYLLEGELEVTVEGKKNQLYAGNCFLINTKQLHGTKCVKGNKTILVQIPISFVESYLPNIHQLLFVWNYRTANAVQKTKIEKLKEVLDQMRIIDDIRPDGYVLRFNSLLFELLFLLYHHFAVELSKTDLDRRAKSMTQLDPVLSYTIEHYKEPVSIREIAEVAALQPEYFCRFFKKNMGMTYLEYLNEIRLSHIYRDLLTTEEAVGRILEKHGFTNYKLFQRLFQKHFGDTPTKIRKRMDKKPF